MTAYLPILIAMMVAVGFVVVVMVASSLVVPMRRNAIKNSPYECGVEPVGNARGRFNIKFYLVAVLFRIFGSSFRAARASRAASSNAPSRR